VKNSVEELNSALGQRVSVRIQINGGYQDFLGVLEAPGEIRKKDGSLAQFDQSSIYAWRVVEPITEVGKGLPLSLRIREIELAAFHTWLPRFTQERGPWQIRIDSGITKRANSVLVLGDPVINSEFTLQDEIQKVQKIYSQSGLPLVFMVPTPLGERTEEFLRQNNWKTDGEILTMIGDADAISPPDEKFHLEVIDNPSADWLELERDQELQELFTRTPASYISISQKDKVVARARIGFDNSWGILTRVFVNESSRGQGLGETIVQAAANIARRRNIRQLALHVDVDNVSAIALYSKLGFRKHHVARFYQNRSMDSAVKASR
jgi:RimJ/RimL family protein N-acetyltransferase